MNLIYHITTPAWWNTFSSSEDYASENLRQEGFIHCSRPEQVKGVLERYFPNRQDLLLLHIDPELLSAELKYEAATQGELFPHVYGEINREAIVKVEAIQN